MFIRKKICKLMSLRQKLLNISFLLSIFLICSFLLNFINRDDEPKLKIDDMSDDMKVFDICPELSTRYSFENNTEVDVNIFIENIEIAYALCTIDIIKHLAASVHATILLFGQTHMDAFTYGRPYNVENGNFEFLFPLSRRDKFLSSCHSWALSEWKMECSHSHSSIIVNLFNSMYKNQSAIYAQEIHLLLYSFNSVDHVINIPNYFVSVPVTEVFPPKVFSYGGIYLMSPGYYPFSTTGKSVYTDNQVRQYTNSNDTINGNIFDRKHGKPCSDQEKGKKQEQYDHLFPESSFDNQFALSTWNYSFIDRKEWYNQDDHLGQTLTDRLANLNKVEIENGFSAGCPVVDTLKVVEFNMERGATWLFAASKLKKIDADIIILNEMDIGMARSQQVHTTRLLASHLKMNYAWGLEFVELTRGNKEEQDFTKGMYDFTSLHGNAILSKCEMYNPQIFRNQIKNYFTKKKLWMNADGHEKRLGGRMGLFVKMRMQGANNITVGSVHKIERYTEEIQSYIDDSKAIIAGDQYRKYCSYIKLDNVDNISHHTFPSSCHSFGYQRGDIICANIEIAKTEETIFPCVSKYGIKVSLSDHAITYVSLKLT